jgi:GNAT superfamily N-acetyltransferase
MSQLNTKNVPAKGSVKKKNGRAITPAKALRAMHFLHRYGFLRAMELGALMSPMIRTPEKNGEAIARQLRAAGYIHEIELPDRAGRAIVLSEAGAEFLRDTGTDDAVENSEWLNKRSKKPCILRTWKHDLVAIRVLAHMEEHGYDVIPEYTIKKLHPKGFSIVGGDRNKRPDGLIKVRDVADDEYDADSWTWLEVERSRKKDSDMRDLANIILKVYETKYQEDAFSSEHLTLPFVSQVAIVHSVSSRAEKTKSVKHENRIRSALIKTIREKNISIDEEEQTLVVPFLHIEYLNYSEFVGGINYMVIADGYDELSNRPTGRQVSSSLIEGTTIETDDDLPNKESLLVEDRRLDEDAPPFVRGLFQVGCFARTSEGALIGGIIGARCKTRCEVRSMWVHESFRQKGVGTRLVQAFESRAKEYGCNSFVLETFNEEAFYFFRKLSYEGILWLNEFTHGATRYTMTKRIIERT